MILKKIENFILNKSNSYIFYKNNYLKLKKDYKTLNEKNTVKNVEYNLLYSKNNENREEINHLRKLNKSFNKEIERLNAINNNQNNEINKLLNLFEKFNMSFNQLRASYIEQTDYLKYQLGNDIQKIDNFLFEFSGNIEDFENKINDLNKNVIEKIHEQNNILMKHQDNNYQKLLSVNKSFINKHDQLNINFIDKYNKLNSDFINLKNVLSDKDDMILNYLKDNLDLTGIEIIKKISEDLSQHDYTNLESLKKINEMGLFDEIYYKEKYAFDKDINPLLHYVYKGYEENKNPNSQFDNLVYKKSDKNVCESYLNPLVYFVSKGINEGNIKFNENMVLVHHINKYELDDKIENFHEIGIVKNKNKPQLIVSLTSYPERIYDIHYCLYSLLNQTLKPNKVILWLSEEEFPDKELDLPKEVLKLKRNGLTIKFCENHKSYKKIIPAIKEYPNDIIVTADDDIFYPNNWLKLLYDDYVTNSDNIIAHRCRRISLDEKKYVKPYNEWGLINNDYNPSLFNLPTGAGGVLYPPHSLYKDITNENLFLDLCDGTDDIWFWAMAVLNDTEIKVANHHLNNSLIYVNPARECNLINEKTLWHTNISEQKNYNNIINVIRKYPKLEKIVNKYFSESKK